MYLSLCMDIIYQPKTNFKTISFILDIMIIVMITGMTAIVLQFLYQLYN